MQIYIKSLNNSFINFIRVVVIESPDVGLRLLIDTNKLRNNKFNKLL